MKELYAISRLIFNDRDSIKALVFKRNNSPITKLFDILFSGAEMEEVQVMTLIYKKKNSTAFAGLKSRMRDILFNYLIYTHFSVHNNRSRLVQISESLKNSILSILLKENGLLELMIKYLEKAINIAIKCEAIENVIIQARLLVWYYSVKRESIAKYKKYSNILCESIILLNIEIKSLLYITEFQKYQVSTVTITNIAISEKALFYYKEISKIQLKETLTIRFNKYLLLAFYYEHSKKYRELLTLTIRTIAEFKSLNVYEEKKITIIIIRQICANLQVGKFKSAISSGLEYFSSIKEATFDWYRLGYYIVKAYFYQADFEAGINFQIQLLNHTKFNKLPPYMKEVFFITLGFSHILVDAKNYVNGKTFTNKLPEFRIAKFLNTVPVYSKDKRGINISILLLHAAYLIQKNKFSEAIDRIESLNRYAGRYLRKDDTFRSNCMIKMLVQMAKADFHPIKTERYTASLRKQLNLVPVTGSGGNIEVEIIPFEVLWDILMKAIQPVATSRRRNRA